MTVNQSPGGSPKIQTYDEAVFGYVFVVLLFVLLFVCCSSCHSFMVRLLFVYFSFGIRLLFCRLFVVVPLLFVYRSLMS